MAQITLVLAVVALAAPAAAFMNAWQMHNQEYDCLHEGAVVHAMATVLPAALAAAEMRGGVSGAAAARERLDQPQQPRGPRVVAAVGDHEDEPGTHRRA